jgi:hypothetical protein
MSLEAPPPARSEKLIDQIFLDASVPSQQIRHFGAEFGLIRPPTSNPDFCPGLSATIRATYWGECWGVANWLEYYYD